MITRSFWILNGLLTVMVIGGVLLLNSGLIAMALPLMAYLIVAVFFAPGKPKLKAERSLSTDRITQGMDVRVSIQVENEGARIEELRLTEELPLAVQSLEGSLSQVTSLAHGEAFEYEYHFQGWRGNYYYEDLFAQVMDPFGMFKKLERLPAKGNVLVYPDVNSIKAIPIRPPQTKGFTGPIPSRKSGTGMDFLGVRQYHLGDSLRHINWKKSVRHSVDLFTNEYEQERIADVGLILDARPHCDVSFEGRRLFEYSVQLTASLAEMFLDQGHCLSLLIYSAGISRVYPGYGKAQRERVLEALARADTGINYALEHLRYFPVRLLPPRGQLVYISPLTHTDLEPLLRFRAQGYHLLVISPDPLYFERQNGSGTLEPDFQLALRFAQVERDLLCANLHRAGIKVVNWEIDQSLSTVLEQIRFQYMLQQRNLRFVL